MKLFAILFHVMWLAFAPSTLFPFIVSVVHLISEINSLREQPAQYPHQSIQIVLWLYQSPAEVLAGFDIDTPCYAYDGQYLVFPFPSILPDGLYFMYQGMGKPARHCYNDLTM